MTRYEVLMKLRGEISQEEYEGIKAGTLKEISADNRKLILEMMEEDTISDSATDIPASQIEDLRDITYKYLGKYYKECPPAWKWIFLSCAYVAFVNLKPMHAQQWVHYETRIVDGEVRYYCPAKSKEVNTNCSYCVCQHMDRRSVTAGCVKKI